MRRATAPPSPLESTPDETTCRGIGWDEHHDPAEKGRKGRRRLMTKLEGNGGHGDGTHQHRDGDQHLGLLLPLLEAQARFRPEQSCQGSRRSAHVLAPLLKRPVFRRIIEDRRANARKPGIAPHRKVKRSLPAPFISSRISFSTCSSCSFRGESAPSPWARRISSHSKGVTVMASGA